MWRAFKHLPEYEMDMFFVSFDGETFTPADERPRLANLERMREHVAGYVEGTMGWSMPRARLEEVGYTIQAVC